MLPGLGLLLSGLGLSRLGLSGLGLGLSRVRLSGLPVRLAAVRALKGIADDLGVTRAQLALAWVLRNAEVTSVITGATRAEQVAGNVRASDITLTQAQLDEIDALFPAL